MERNSFLIVSKEVLNDKRIPATARLLLAQLLDHRNKKTGQCNPKQSLLAEELAISVDTVQRGLIKLRDLGLIRIQRGQYGCRYEIQIPQNAVSQTANCGFPKPQNAVSDDSGPLYEPYIREPSTDRAQNPRAAGASSPHKYKNSRPPAAPRKSMQQATMEAYHRMFGHVQEG